MVKLLLLLPLTCAVQVREKETVALDYGGIKSAMVELSMKSRAVGKIDEGTINAVNGFLDTIKGDLLSSLEGDRNHSQTIYDDALQAVNDCDSQRTTWFDNDWVQWNTDIDGRQSTHDDCRVQEDVTYTNFTQHCQVFKSRVCNWNVCDLPHGGFAGGDTDAVNDYVGCLCNFFDEHRTHYYTERTNCEVATNLHHAQTTQCDTDQGSFEADCCSREDKVQFRCRMYDTCRFETERTMLQIKKETVDIEAIFQAQFVALHHLLCYGEQILNNSTDLTGCDAVGDSCEDEFTDCPMITYPEPAAFIKCMEPANPLMPCFDEFLSHYYGNLDGSFTPVAECEPCHGEDCKHNTWGGDRKTIPSLDEPTMVQGHASVRVGVEAEVEGDALIKKH